MNKKALTIIWAIVSFFVIITFASNILVEKSVTGKLYSNVEQIPHRKVGLLLGTSKYLKNGTINLYYKYRIDAVEALFKAGKIDYILISGDNSKEQYDEPTSMKNDLIARGIPAEKIILDYAGFRTLDSIVRCKEIFNQNDITIISQRFHNERAIFIANEKNISAIGFNAKDVTVYYGFKTQLREKLARVKMVFDLSFGKKPKFMGNSIQIK